MTDRTGLPRRTIGLATAAVVAVAVAVAPSGHDARTVPQDLATRPAAVSPATSTTGVASTQPADVPTDERVVVATPEPAQRGDGCARSLAVADVDGDGREDRIGLDQGELGFVELVVCLADGTVHAAEWWGMGEEFAVADIDADGAVEIFFGGNTALWEGVEVARWYDDRLVVVQDGDAPWTLTAGLLGVGPDGRPDETSTWGCADVDGDGADEIVDVAANLVDGTWEVRTRTWVLRGDEAALVDELTSRVPARDDDPDTYMLVTDPSVASFAPCGRRRLGHVPAGGMTPPPSSGGDRATV